MIRYSPWSIRLYPGCPAICFESCGSGFVGSSRMRAATCLYCFGGSARRNACASFDMSSIAVLPGHLVEEPPRLFRTEIPRRFTALNQVIPDGVPRCYDEMLERSFLHLVANGVSLVQDCQQQI